MSMPSGTELLLIFGIVILLFGAKKIPDLAKGIGQGIRNFKKEMKELITSEEMFLFKIICGSNPNCKASSI